MGSTAFEGFFRLFFDRQDINAVEKSHGWVAQVYQELEAFGIFPYRIDIDSMKSIVNRPQDSFWDSVLKIKQALDPNGIISPGRYCPTFPISKKTTESDSLRK